jgi:hypothetical protein
MSQVQVSRWMSDRLDQRPAASIQLTTSNNENKANRLHPFTEYVWWKAYKSTKIQ